MSNEKNKELEIEEITVIGDELGSDDLEGVAGGNCSGCSSCSTKPPAKPPAN